MIKLILPLVVDLGLTVNKVGHSKPGLHNMQNKKEEDCNMLS